MAITDDLVHGTILAWAVDPGTPAQQVEMALQRYRERFDVEPQVVLGDFFRTPVRGETDDAQLVARQSHIEFRAYTVVNKGELRIAMKFGAEPRAPLQAFSPPDVLPPPKKKRTEKQEKRHQEMVDTGMIMGPTKPIVAAFVEEIEEPAEVSMEPVSRGFKQFARRH